MSKSRFSTESLQWRDRAKAIADTLEVPENDCNCPPRKPTRRSPFGDPCEHLLAKDHNLTVEEWSILVSRGYPEEWITEEDYRRDISGEPERWQDVWFSPRQPKSPSRDTVPGSASRAELYEWRFQNNYALWHPDDITMSEIDHIGTRIRTLPNGRIESLGLYWIGADEDEYNDDC